MTLFTKQFPANIYAIAFVAFALFLTSCGKDTIAKSLGYICDNKNELKNLKTLTDVRNNFKIDIPENWKREFFVDNYESRLYCADTTKELNSTYTFDLGHYSGKLTIDEAFIKKAKGIATKNKSAEILNSKIITLNGKPGYCIVTKSTNASFAYQTLQAYFKNKNDSYYFFKLDVYGSENMDTRFCEALNLLENSKMN